MMDRDGFRQFLQERQLDEAAITASLSIVERFEDFLRAENLSADANSARAFSAHMIDADLNTHENYVALARYGWFVENRAVYVAIFELLDGAEAMDNLHRKLGDAIGEQARDVVFAGIDLPPLGTPNTQKPPLMQAVMERMAETVDPAISRPLLTNSLRDLPDTWYSGLKEKFAACGSVDAYLEQKGDDYIAELTALKDEDKLYFTQEVTDDVIAFVDSHPEIRQGVRAGNVIYEVKIPYMTKEYLAVTDEQLKRYYYCHCPWARESLRNDAVQVPGTFCQCSAGFHKRPWEIIFDQPLKAEVVESVLMGDPWCKFAIHLPDHAVE